MLFKIIDKNISLIEETHFDLEADIQKLVENNLKDIFPDFNLTFIKSEVVAGNFRFDSLAFDEENKIFYIVKYKNVEKMSLIDQGVAYLKILLERKAEFTYLLDELKGIELKPNAIDWASSRVLFVAPSYNNYQLEIAKLNNAPFSLYKFSKYGKDFFTIDRIEYKAKSKIDFNDFVGPDSREVNEKIKVYDENDHLKDKSQAIKDLYQNIKKKILELDGDIFIEYKKNYVAFKGTTNICDLEIFKKDISVFINLNSGELDDPFKIAKLMKYADGKKLGHHGNGDYRVKIYSKDDIDKLMFLIKQSYKING